MGLFSRKEPEAGTGRRSASRSSLSSEAQASELRGRARRRLIGALALVLAAVIIVPMLFDSSDPVQQASTPVVVPSIVPPEPSQNLAAAPSTPSAQTLPSTGAQGADAVAGTDAATDNPAPGTANATAPESSTEPPAPADAAAEQSDTQTEPKPEPAPAEKPAEKPEPKTEPKPEPKPQPKPDARTDDGAVAMALLEGRLPPQAAAQANGKGNYILQIAAYGTANDADIRRDKLVAAGVTNAYVEEAVSGGKPTYRLRVGPFPTRDAAQAAQARLRALGYDNGFISTK